MFEQVNNPQSPLSNSGSLQKKILLEEKRWKVLLTAISKQKCTPFLGPELAYGEHLRAKIALDWARQEENYPFDDDDDLARVTQFLATENYPTYPKEQFIELLNKMTLPNLNDVNEPHRILARLQLPIYVKTTYDNFMLEALKKEHRDGRREICRWNKYIDVPSVLTTDYWPTPANPLVFHFYGNLDSPNSLVLTEDDHLDFLANLSRTESLIPRDLQTALTNTSLLFLGYRFSDLDFRVMLRSLARYLRKNLYGQTKANISVQLLAVGQDLPPQKLELVEKYLSEYCGQLTITTCLMTCQEFLGELQRRWTEFSRTRGANE